MIFAGRKKNRRNEVKKEGKKEGWRGEGRRGKEIALVSVIIHES